MSDFAWIQSRSSQGGGLLEEQPLGEAHLICQKMLPELRLSAPMGSKGIIRTSNRLGNVPMDKESLGHFFCANKMLPE